MLVFESSVSANKTEHEAMPLLSHVVQVSVALVFTPTTFSVPSQFSTHQAVQHSSSALQNLTTLLPPPVNPSSSSFNLPSPSVVTTTPGISPFHPTKHTAPHTHSFVLTQSSSLATVASPPPHASIQTQTHSPSRPIASTPSDLTSATLKDSPESRSAPRTSTRSSTSPSETKNQYSAIDRHSEQAPTSTADGVRPSPSSTHNPPSFSTGVIPSQSSASTLPRASSAHEVVIVLAICAVFVVCILLAGVLFYLRARSRRRRQAAGR